MNLAHWVLQRADRAAFLENDIRGVPEPRNEERSQIQFSGLLR